eukprot:1314219-Alexandrium_andersonii.AAC.1
MVLPSLKSWLGAVLNAGLFALSFCFPADSVNTLGDCARGAWQAMHPVVLDSARKFVRDGG